MLILNQCWSEWLWRDTLHQPCDRSRTSGIRGEQRSATTCIDSPFVQADKSRQVASLPVLIAQLCFSQRSGARMTVTGCVLRSVVAIDSRQEEVVKSC